MRHALNYLRSAEIRWRLFRLLTTIAGCLIFIVAGFWHVQIKPALQRERVRLQQEIAQRAADRIGAFIESHITIFSAVGQSIGSQTAHRAQQRTMTRIAKLAPAIHEISLSDSRGKELLRASPWSESRSESAALDDGEAIRRISLGDVAIGAVYYKGESEPFTTISAPSRFATEHAGGLLLAEISLRSLWNEVAHLEVGSAGYIYVVTPNGDLIAHPDYSTVLAANNFSHVAEVADFKSGRRDHSGEIEPGLKGNPVIATYAVVPRTRWGVIVEEPAEQALGAIAKLQTLMAMVLFVTVVAIFAVSLRFSRKIAEPISQLQHGAERLAQGDLTHKLNVHTGDEIESLADAFNHMADALKHAHDDLEAKVTERTHEIASLYTALAPLKPAASLNQMLAGIIERLLDATNADAALIRLRDHATGGLFCAAASGFDESYLKRTETLVRGSAVEQAFTTGEPIISPEIIYDPRLKGKMQVQVGLRSCALLPLTVAGQTRGVIHVASRTPGYFSPAKETHLRAIARQMAIAVENHELYEETHRNLERIRALHNIDLAITSTLDLRTVLQVLLEQIDRFLPFATATSITLLDRNSGELEPVLCRDLDEAVWKKAADIGGNRLADRVHRKREACVIENLQCRGENGNPEFFIEHGLYAYLGVPLMAYERCLGVLGLYTKSAHAFTDREIEFLSTLGGQAAIAIQNSQIYEELGASKRQLETTNQRLERSLQKLQGFYIALTPVAASGSTEQIMARIIDRLVEATGADAALTRVWDETKQTYPIIDHRGFPESFIERVAEAPRGGAIEWVVTHGEPIIAPDIRLEPRFKSKVQAEFGLKSCAMLPLTVGGKPRAVIHLTSRKLGYFDEDQSAQLSAIARQMGIALENAELYKQVQKKVSELERQTLELQQASKVKDEFLSVVSHELRTPLIAIMGYADLIKEEFLGKNTPAQANGIRIIREQTGALLDMIRTILDVTHLEAGNMPVEHAPVDSAALLAGIKDGYAQFPAGSVALRWDWAPDLPKVVTDGPKIRHILSNLIDNALKFTHDGSILVSARHLAANGCLEFQVKDSGIGIAGDMLPFVFEKFRQIDSTANRSYEGIGLGLYIVKQFTQLLGGEIRVESELGGGSTFTVTIPCAPANAGALRCDPADESRAPAPIEPV